MGDLSRIKKGQKSQEESYGNSSFSCSVCDGKKYTLVATSSANQRQTVYERQDCHFCVSAENNSSMGYVEESSPVKKKKLSGTGYLRNKKRRRKDDV